MKVTPNSVDVTTYFALRLAATGAEATGLTVTTFDLQYVRSGVVPSAKVDASALAATDTAHTDNSAIEIDATDQPGLYRVDWPDAAFASGVREVILTVKCATAFTEHLRVELEHTQTGDNFTRLGAPAGASISADIAVIEAQTDDIGTAGAGLTNLPWNASWDAEVQSEVTDALAPLTALSLASTIDDGAPGADDFTGATALSSANDFYNGSVLVFTSGALQSMARQISDYVGAQRRFLFTGTGENADAPFPAAPANGDSFVIVGRIGT